MAHKAVETRISGEKKLIFKEAFSSFSVDDIAKVKDFYSGILSLDVNETKEGLEIRFENGQNVFIYPKADHKPAAFTVLNLLVDDIDQAVDSLTNDGVSFEQYGAEIKTDEKGIFRDEGEMGPQAIAWFKEQIQTL